VGISGYQGRIIKEHNKRICVLYEKGFLGKSQPFSRTSGKVSNLFFHFFAHLSKKIFLKRGLIPKKPLLLP